MSHTLFVTALDGNLVPWNRTRVRSLPSDDQNQYNEGYLEGLIAGRPDVLGLGAVSDHSDINGPFVAFSQVKLEAMNGRTIYPDLVLLWQSGHVVVVEVKLFDNPELRGRQVISQLLEYAACLADCDESQLLQLFGTGLEAGSWAELVGKFFPGASPPGRLANQFLDKFRSRRLHLIIACDEAPPGLKELVSGVIGQSALGEYTFRVVEVMPFVPELPGRGIIFLPRSVLATEIVARTAVTVTVGRGFSANASVTASVTPLNDQEAAIKNSRLGLLGKSQWTRDRFVDEAASRVDLETMEALNLYLSAGEERGWLKWSIGDSADHGNFSFVLGGKSFISLYTTGGMMANLKNLSYETGSDFREYLLALPGVTLPTDKHPTIKAEMWRPHAREILERLDGYARIEMQ